MEKNYQSTSRNFGHELAPVVYKLYYVLYSICHLAGGVPMRMEYLYEFHLHVQCAYL